MTKPADTDVDSAADEPNTAVMDSDPLRKAASGGGAPSRPSPAGTTAPDPNEESTAIVRNPLAGESAPSAQPRGGTAPYPTIDARTAEESVRLAAASPASEPRIEDAPTLSEASGPMPAVVPPEPAIEVVRASNAPSTGATLPGAGPSAPSPAPSAARKDAPIVAAPRIVTFGESTHPTPRSPSREGSKRVVSVTGAFIGATLAIALVAAGALIGGAVLVARDRSPAPVVPSTTPTATEPSPPSAPTTAAAAPGPSSASSAGPTAGPGSTKDAATVASTTGAASATGSAEPMLPKETGPKPSKVALDRMTAALRAPLEACVRGMPKAFYAIHLELDGATGKPLGVDAVKPLHGTVAGACAMRAGLDARIPPFAGKSFALDVKFAPP